MKRTPLRRSHMTAKGPTARRRAAKRRAINAVERKAKTAAKERDGWMCVRCHALGRMPKSMGQYLPAFMAIGCRLEAAHLIDKGMGGDGGKFSCERKHFVTLCHDCHQGPRSVHSGHVVMRFDAERMGDGPVQFVDQEPGRCAVGATWFEAAEQAKTA